MGDGLILLAGPFWEHDELPMILTDQQNQLLCFYYQVAFAY